MTDDILNFIAMFHCFPFLSLTLLHNIQATASSKKDQWSDNKLHSRQLPNTAEINTVVTLCFEMRRKCLKDMESQGAYWEHYIHPTGQSSFLGHVSLNC